MPCFLSFVPRARFILRVSVNVLGRELPSREPCIFARYLLRWMFFTSECIFTSLFLSLVTRTTWHTNGMIWVKLISFIIRDALFIALMTSVCDAWKVRWPEIIYYKHSLRYISHSIFTPPFPPRFISKTRLRIKSNLHL